MESDKFGIGAGSLLFYVPVLTGKGYFVLRPNYRGSAGTAELRSRHHRGYFQQMASDVMLGVDALIARGLVDPDRLALTGWSAGGTLVDKLITMTDRFKVASSGAGISNWISLYGQTDNTSFRRTWFGGTPWRKDAPFDRSGTTRRSRTSRASGRRRCSSPEKPTRGCRRSSRWRCSARCGRSTCRRRC